MLDVSSDDIRVDEIYHEASELKKHLVNSCTRCKGAGYLPAPNFSFNKETLSLNTFPCVCMRRYIHLLDLMIAGVEVGIANEVVDRDVSEVLVNEIDISIENEPNKHKPSKLYVDHIDKYVRKCSVALSRGYSFLFTGCNSTGKTFAALKLLHEVLKRSNSGHYINFRLMMRLVNKSITSSGEDKYKAEKFVKILRKVDFLVIDEIGKRAGSHEHVVNEIETLLKERDMFKKPCALISNKTYKELLDEYNTDVSDFSSVFMKNYKVFLFNPGSDFRKMNRESWDL